MTVKNRIEIIKERKQEIVDKMRVAYGFAFENPKLEFSVMITNTGVVFISEGKPGNPTYIPNTAVIASYSSTDMEPWIQEDFEEWYRMKSGIGKATEICEEEIVLAKENYKWEFLDSIKPDFELELEDRIYQLEQKSRYYKN
ncbi:MAG: hypothetical protein IJ121_05630 [Eubacterium sp.]|nr:hypothetical protein [Eubacterium sp.]